MKQQLSGNGFLVEIYLDVFNKRVRVDDYIGIFEECIGAAVKASIDLKAEKLIVKARSENFAELVERGFLYEATVEKYYSGSDGYFFAKYFTNKRRNSDRWEEEDQLLAAVQKNRSQQDHKVIPNEYILRKAELTDAETLADLYNTVFDIYPVPMNDPDYVKSCMKKDTAFFIYTYNGEIVSSASAEINTKYHNAEITDCATLPEHRQFGLMKQLIVSLEQHLRSLHIYCFYSIARSLSYGMNAALSSLGYRYGGRLANNCYIFDKLEDMNLWSKHVSH
jgi:beta-lysine N6-acetyltransferase